MHDIIVFTGTAVYDSGARLSIKRSHAQCDIVLYEMLSASRRRLRRSTTSNPVRNNPFRFNPYTRRYLLLLFSVRNIKKKNTVPQPFPLVVRRRDDNILCSRDEICSVRQTYRRLSHRFRRFILLSFRYSIYNSHRDGKKS
jgi:hypothetical protein